VSQIFQVDLQHVPNGGEEIGWADFRPGNVGPDFKRVFKNRVFETLNIAVIEEQITGDYFDVEHPAGEERPIKYGAGQRRDAEELGATLRIVNGETEKGGDESGEDAAQVVAQVGSFDVAAKQLDASAEDHFDRGLGVEKGGEIRKKREWRGEVGIPETDDFGMEVVERVEDSKADGFGLAAIGRLL
jgi:hypothetical protein